MKICSIAIVTTTRLKKLEEGLANVNAQYNNALRNMQNINEDTFDLEKNNIGNTLRSLTQEVAILVTKME